MDVLTAWNLLNCHTYFTRPAYDEEGNIYSFYNDFHSACDISPIEHNNEIVWIAEMGHFSLEDKHCYYYCPDKDIIKPTYEEVIIAVAEFLVEKYGMDMLDDYYYYDEDEPLMIKDGKYFVSNPNSKSGWKTDEIIKRIRSFEDE